MGHRAESHRGFDGVDAEAVARPRTLEARAGAHPRDVVVPALRGASAGRTGMRRRPRRPSGCCPEDDPHGAVAVAERQTAGRGRLGRTWTNSGLMFSVCLRPPPPVADWPDADARRRTRRRRRDRERRRRSSTRTTCSSTDGRWRASSPRRRNGWCVGIGVNVNGTDWPGAGFVDRDRLELLVDVLERLEHGYDAWLAARAPGYASSREVAAPGGIAASSRAPVGRARGRHRASTRSISTPTSTRSRRTG